jgi:hypothetical protein
MILTRETELGEKHTPMALCLQQIQHGLTWTQTRASTVTNWLLTARAMAR